METILEAGALEVYIRCGGHEEIKTGQRSCAFFVMRMRRKHWYGWIFRNTTTIGVESTAAAVIP